MLSRRLFDDDEPRTVPESFAVFQFDVTPVKADSILSVVTPNIKRNLFLDFDDDSGLGMDDHYIHTLSFPSKRKRDSDQDNTFKRRKTTGDIKDMVNKLTENNDLVSDGSGTFVLPTVPGKHQDLKSITPETLADLINGSYDDVIDSYRIIDCRYPYEFEGGHIKGAENKHLHEQILDLLKEAANERQVLIFHCEFSSERGPKMLRFLRGKDRELNKENYPLLNFPEVYILDGGYKNVYGKHPELCDPISYRPMLHSDYSADLRHFRAKSKTWSRDEKRKFARKSMRF